VVVLGICLIYSGFSPGKRKEIPRVLRNNRRKRVRRAKE
jgi:hypothetical protein